MQAAIRSVAIVALAILMGSCGESAKWRDLAERYKIALEDLTKRAEAVSYAAIKAIPGERYNQLIDDVHGTDPKKKEAALLFIKSLFGVDAEHEYTAYATFMTPAGAKIRADLFVSPVDGLWMVKEHLRAGGKSNIAYVDSLQLTPSNPRELIEAKYRLALDSMFADCDLGAATRAKDFDKKLKVKDEIRAKGNSRPMRAELLVPRKTGQLPAVHYAQLPYLGYQNPKYCSANFVYSGGFETARPDAKRWKKELKGTLTADANGMNTRFDAIAAQLADAHFLFSGQDSRRTDRQYQLTAMFRALKDKHIFIVVNKADVDRATSACKLSAADDCHFRIVLSVYDTKTGDIRYAGRSDKTVDWQTLTNTASFPTQINEARPNDGPYYWSSWTVDPTQVLSNDVLELRKSIEAAMRLEEEIEASEKSKESGE